jgi:cysteine desulfurase/selenocysteine lyase
MRRRPSASWPQQSGYWNKVGIAVRTDHHCAQPILRRYGLESAVRPSLAFYNTYEEVDRLVSTVKRIQGGNVIY